MSPPDYFPLTVHKTSWYGLEAAVHVVLWLHTFSQSKPNLVLSFPSPQAENRQKQSGWWRGGRKKRKRKIKMKIKWTKLRDESWKTVENDGGDGIDWAFRWKHRTQRWKKRKSTYDTQSLRNITLSSYWVITLPRAVISVRVEKMCVCVREKERETTET